MIDGYDWAGGREAMLRFGPADAPVAILALPPFEEANRTRTFAVGLLRALAARGIAGRLPDLPGTGESLVPTQHATLADWRSAFASAAQGAAVAIGIRAGALCDGDAAVKARWRLSPTTGAALVRELIRTRQAAAREEGVPFDAATIVVDGPPIAIAGNPIARTLLRELGGAEPSAMGAIRTVRLDTEMADADRKVAGTPLWRRAEPDDDRGLAATLADDIAGWVRRCAG